MIKIINRTQLEIEVLELNGYTLTLRWNNLYPSGHVFWHTGNFEDSILEIGMNAESYALEIARIVNIQSLWVSPVEIVDLNEAQSARQKGIPVVQWTKNKPAPYLVKEPGVFNIHIAAEHLSIRIGEECRVTKVFQAERTLFGINDDDNLVAIQIINLQPDEVDIIKSTFQRTVNGE